MNRLVVPAKIGRFEIERVLDSDPHAVAYFARDARLGRPVIVKKLTPPSPRERADIARLLAGARTVGELSHPGIVPLIDAGEDNGMPYLVYDHVEGESLSQHLGARPRMDVERAVEITIQLLKAVGAAHEKGIVHRSLKPESIILTRDDVPRIMDFGVASWVADQGARAGSFSGSPPPCMSPESAGAATLTPAGDLLSITMLLYRMLTGSTSVSGSNGSDVARQLLNGSVAAPSSVNPEIDERLDDVVLKALASDPEQRFESAAAMENALHACMQRDPENAAAEKSPAGTLDFLLRRMRHKSDFPALSATMSAINRASSSEDESVNVLTKHILKDFALTSKLLKMVNSAYFGAFGGTISTVSKAVVIMGVDRIRNAAITLMLFEHLQNKAQAVRLKEDLVASYFAGVLARQLVVKTGLRNVEEAFICATFHNLGRLLTSFYFPEEDHQIQRLIRQKGMAEMPASIQVLGVSFEDLGIGVAKVWNFPPRLIQSMRHIGEDEVVRADTEENKLRALAHFSAGVCDSMRELDEQTCEGKIKELVQRFDGTLGVNTKLLASSVKHCSEELAKDAVTLNLSARGTAFLANTAQAPEQTVAAAAAAGAAAEPVAAVKSVIEEARLEVVVNPVVEPLVTDTAAQRKATLMGGIQDITTSLMGEFNLNDILREILETLYRGIGFTRVLLFVRDASASALKPRFGLGDNVDEIIISGFSIALGVARDVFQAAVANGADVFIENVNAEAIRKHIPPSYRKAIPASSFALFPIIVKGKPVGLLYGDCDLENAIRFSVDELALLKTLRNQAVIAIKQKA
jgi:eukaryotic-like serine/threonine-protein kinase